MKIALPKAPSPNRFESHKRGFYKAYSKFDAVILEAMKAIPGARGQKDKSGFYWELPMELAPRFAELVATYVGRQMEYPARNVQPKVGFYESLHPYQQKYVRLVGAQGTGWALFKPGLGKSPAALAARVADTTLIVCPAKVRGTWKDEVEKWLPGRSIYVHKPGPKGWQYDGQEFIVSSYEMLPKIIDKLPARIWNGIFDECFVAGTVVHTEDGPRPIEQVQVGERVWSWNEAAQTYELCLVEHSQKSYTRRLVDVGVCDEEITSTTEHPYLTSEGWKNADSLVQGSYVRSVWSEVSSGAGKEGALQSSMFKQGEQRNNEGQERGETDSQVWIKGSLREMVCGGKLETDVGEKSNAQCGDSQEGQRYFEGDEIQAIDKGWQRYGDDGATSDVAGGARKWMASGGSGSDWTAGQRLSVELQAGLSSAIREGWRGSRWEKSQQLNTKRTRPKEGSSPVDAGVDGHSRVESTGIRELASYVAVYNLQVADTANYLVGHAGVVVHNCHYLKSYDSERTMASAKLIAAHPEMMPQGLSATIAPDNLMDIYQPIHTLTPWRWGKPSSFRERYFELEKHKFAPSGIIRGLRHDTKEELADRIDGIGVAATQDEWGHLLQPIITKVIHIEDHWTAEEALASRARLDQYAATESETILEQHTAATRDIKEEAAAAYLKELVAEGNEKIAVVTYNRDIASSLSETFKRLKDVDHDVTLVMGGMPDRDERIKKAASERLSVLVATMDSIKEGLNSLVVFDQIVIVQLYWSPASVAQLIGRFNRLTSKKPTMVHLLQLDGSLDEVIARVLKRKNDDINEVIKAGTGERAIAAMTEPKEEDWQAALRAALE